MKKILTAVAVALVLVSCQKDLPLNSELNPIEKTDLNIPKLYIKAGDWDNSTILDEEIVQETSGIINTKYRTEVYAYLSSPLSKDVVVTATLDNSSAVVETAKKVLEDNSVVALDASALNLETASVTIKAGKTKSETPFVIIPSSKYQETFQAIETGNYAVIALNLSNNEGVEVSKNFRQVLLPFEKQTFYNAQTNPFDGYSKITEGISYSTSSTYSDEYIEDGLYDEDASTMWFSSGQDIAKITLSLQEATDLGGLYFDLVEGYVSKPIIETSLDGENWSVLGMVNLPEGSGDNFKAELYVPFSRKIRAKFVRLTLKPEEEGLSGLRTLFLSR